MWKNSSSTVAKWVSRAGNGRTARDSSYMQPEKIILLPPTHEQSTPSYHVEGNIAPAFIKFLEAKGVTIWQPPQVLEKRGPGDHPIVEIEIEAGTSTSLLEGLIAEFFATAPL